MAIDLQTILPNIPHSLDGTGFLFGAGTSREAGYPMMQELTRQVVGALTAGERSVLDGILAVNTITYDDTTASPNIEELSDYVIAHAINTNSPTSHSLENRFRELIVENLLSHTIPSLDSHCRLINALKARAFGRACTVWIFTTNYDLLFEISAARAGVILENGFCGATERFFNPAQFRSITGEVTGDRFSANSHLTIKLVKLHGSLSWVHDGGNLYERHPDAVNGSMTRVMVLPRRKKVMDTLAEPYNTLFSQTRRVLGTECKYLVSCGFSYGDEHINQHLLLPAMQSNRCRLFALCETEPPGVTVFKALPCFNSAFATQSWVNGQHSTTGTDLWQFSKFVTLFE